MVSVEYTIIVLLLLTTTSTIIISEYIMIVVSKNFQITLKLDGGVHQ